MRRIVLMGDSITYGCNASNKKSSWAGRLEEYLNTNFKNQFEVINNGVLGENAQQGFDDVEDKVIKYTPDIVLIGYGTNDCTKEQGSYVNDFYNFESNMEDIAGTIRSETNASIVFNLAPPVIEELCNTDTMQIYNRDIETYNKAVKKICGPMGLSFIDHYEFMAGRKDLKQLIDSGGIHPNDEGHKLMLENIIASINHLFS